MDLIKFFYRINKTLLGFPGPIKWGNYQTNIINNKNYNLIRSEFVNALGFSVDTLKKPMTRGHHQNQYILKYGKYLFTRDTKVGPKQEKIKPMPLGTKRIRNRDNHFNSKNSNYKPKFQRTNEIRMLAKLKLMYLKMYRSYCLKRLRLPKRGIGKNYEKD